MRIGKTIQTLALAGILSAAPGFAAAAGSQGTPSTTVLQTQVRQALNKLAWYGVFDNLNYNVDDKGNVTLSGQVTRYVTHNDAVNVVKRLAGVTSVTDNIEVLPLSNFDDNIRIRAYNAIYGYPALSRYEVQARPPIRIIVNHGDVTLAGYVANEMDRELVYNRIRALPGTFKITNDLKLD